MCPKVAQKPTKHNSFASISGLFRYQFYQSDTNTQMLIMIEYKNISDVCKNTLNSRPHSYLCIVSHQYFTARLSRSSLTSLEQMKASKRYSCQKYRFLQIKSILNIVSMHDINLRKYRYVMFPFSCMFNTVRIEQPLQELSQPLQELSQGFSNCGTCTPRGTPDAPKGYARKF